MAQLDRSRLISVRSDRPPPQMHIQHSPTQTKRGSPKFIQMGVIRFRSFHLFPFHVFSPSTHFSSLLFHVFSAFMSDHFHFLSCARNGLALNAHVHFYFQTKLEEAQVLIRRFGSLVVPVHLVSFPSATRTLVLWRPLAIASLCPTCALTCARKLEPYLIFRPPLVCECVSKLWTHRSPLGVFCSGPATNFSTLVCGRADLYLLENT